MLFCYINILCTCLISAKSFSYTKLNYNYSQNFEGTISQFEVSLIDQCFAQINGPYAVFGNWKIYEPTYLLEFREENLEIILSRKERFLKFKKMDQSPLTATKFFIETFTVESLNLTMKVLKDSLYWNMNGFYIVKKNPILDTCKFAYSILKIFWDFNVLNALFMCYVSDRIFLYTYNPYNEAAPENWKKIGSFLQDNGHPLTLFEMFIVNSDISSRCKELTYDKSCNLSCYPIKIADLRYELEILDIPKTRKVNNIFDDTLTFSHIIWKKLGANLIVRNITIEEFGTLGANGTFTKALREVFEGTLDARSAPDYQRVWQYESYIELVDGVCYITRKHSVSIIGHLSLMFPLKIRVILILFLAIVSIIFLYVLQSNYFDVFLEILRASLGMSTIHSPSTTAKNLAFIWIIYSFIFITTYLQSQLSAFVATTKSAPVKIESYDDIVLNNYKVYSPLNFVQYFEKTPLSGKVEVMPDLRDCLNLLKTYTNIACVQSCIISKYFVTDDAQIQISPDSLLRKYVVYFFREDSPIKPKYQWLSHLLAQNGILHYLFTIKKSYYFKHPLFEQNRQISIYQIRYIFYFVTVMYFISFFVFLVEMMIGRHV